MGKRYLLALAVVALAAPAELAYADDPTILITAPSGVHYVSSFPFSTSITVQVSHPTGQLSDLNVFDVKVAPSGATPTSILPAGPLGNPFPSNACSSSQMVIAKGVTGCSVNAGTATVSVNWGNIYAGTYTIEVVARHSSQEGSDSETATFQLVSVEHPAPPAVANAYIKTLAKLPAKVHGCVISSIAEQHAKFASYGPKGGPYNTNAIQQDVLTFIGACQ